MTEDEDIEWKSVVQIMVNENGVEREYWSFAHILPHSLVLMSLPC
jgi:hypothetical protein